MSTIVIDNYDSFTFNLVQLLQMEASTPDTVRVFRNDAIGFADLAALAPDRIVLSPGPGHPGKDADFGVCAQVIGRKRELGCPILGVCLGHQGIVLAAGGCIERLPQPRHGKQSRIKLSRRSKLFAGLPDEIAVMRYHSLVATRDSLPAGLVVTAEEPVEGLIMAVEEELTPQLYGVQFHPESIGTPHGRQILRNFIKLC